MSEALDAARKYVEEMGPALCIGERLLAALVAEIEAAPGVKVRGKVGEFATIVVSHSLLGMRVRLLAEGTTNNSNNEESGHG